MNYTNLKTVCLALGPYRNLTTLTATLLFLHPRCQVLNHGSDHILLNPETDFFHNYSEKKFQLFVDNAIQLSAKGKRGRYGGSITLAHAFDDINISNTFSQRYQDTKIKDKIECLFWKESLRVTRFIKETNVDLDGLISKNKKLKFLMPIRNPIDCALSNIKSGHAVALTNSEEKTQFTDVLDVILSELAWFLDQQKKYPDRFFCFFEHTFNKETIHQLADFLKITPDDRWVKDVIDNYNIRHPYQPSHEMNNYYTEAINNNFDSYPAIMEKLHSFVCGVDE